MLARLTAALIGAALVLTAPLAAAQLSIEITGAGAQRIPIAIASRTDFYFEGDANSRLVMGVLPSGQ